MRIVSLFLMTAVLTGCVTESRPANTDAAVTTPASPTTDTLPAAETDSATTEAAGTSKEFVIDVRTQAEWDTGHVPQAVLIPHTEIAERIDEVTKDKQAKIVLYCAVGGRAGKAKAKLEELGFTNVENAGGYDDVKDRYK